MAKNLLDWLKSQTLDRTNLDEKVAGAVKSGAKKIQNWQSGNRQAAQQTTLPQPFKVANDFAVNRIIEPFKAVPKNLDIATNPFLPKKDRAIASLQALGGLTPGIEDLGFAAYDFAKAKSAGKAEPWKSFTGQEYTGLGEATSKGKGGTVANILNYAEFPALLALGGLKAKGGMGSTRMAQNAVDASRRVEIPKTKNIELAPSRLKPVENFRIKVKGEPAKILSGQDFADWTKYYDSKGIKYDYNKLGNQGGFISVSKAEKPPGVNVKPVVKLTKEVGLGKKIVNDVFVKNKSVLEKAGPVGKNTANLITQAEDTGARMAGDVNFRLKQAIDKIPKADKQNFADFVEGRAVPVDPNTAKAVQLWKIIADDVLKRSQEAGLSVGKVESYFPHIVPDSALTPKGKLSFLQKMVDSGVASDIGEADKILSATRRTSPRKYGNLEKSRSVNFPEYKKEADVLFDYISDSYRRIAEAKNYGPNDENLYKMAAEMAGGNVNNESYYKRIIDQMLGKDTQDSVSRQVSSGIRNFQTIRKLSPTTSIKNLTQSISTAFRTDIPATAKAIKEVIFNPDKAKEIAIRTGQLDNEAIKAGMETWGEGNTASKWIKWIGMQGTEKFNRTVATNAGYNFTKKLSEQTLKGSEAAIRELKRLGFNDVKISKGLKESDLLDAALKISKQTQFSTIPSELPYGWNTPAGKVLTQFKSFAYKQTELLGTQAKRIVEEGTKGNFKPFLNTLSLVGVAAPIIGEINATLTSVFKNKKREESSIKRYFANISDAVSLGLFDDIDSLSGKYGPSGKVSALLGPTVGDIYKLGVQGPTSYEPGKFYAREALKTIPAIGQTLSNSLIPNAAVTNVWGGKNVGLPEDQTKIMKSMPKEQGAAYKIQQKQLKANEDAQKPGIFTKIMDKLVPDAGASNGKYDVSTPALKKQAVSFINKKMEAGSPLTEEEAKIVFTGDYEAMSSKTAYESRKKEQAGYTSAMKVYNSESLAPEQKYALYKKLGTSEEEIEYAKMASDNDTDQTLFVQDQLASMSEDERLQFLLRGRSIVNNGMLISDNVLEKLVKSGEISKSESKALKTVSFVKDNNYKGEDGIKIGDNIYKPVKKTGTGDGKGFGTDNMVKVKMPIGVSKKSSASKGSLKLTAPATKKITISKPNLQKKAKRRKIVLKY